MDQIKTYQKKDSFHRLENKKNVEQIIIEKKVIKILKDKKIKKLFNIEEKKIIDTLEAEFSNINTKNEQIADIYLPCPETMPLIIGYTKSPLFSLNWS